MEPHRKVHYLADYVMLQFMSTTAMADAQPSKTSCGVVIGGMSFVDLTDVAEQVTCHACLDAPRYPLDILNHTML